MSSKTAEAFTPNSAVDLDIWRAADLLVKQYGDDAQSAAALLANARRTKGDSTGERVWLRVLMAVRELKRSARQPAELLN
jgi:hypothetical protein